MKSTKYARNVSLVVDKQPSAIFTCRAGCFARKFIACYGENETFSNMNKTMLLEKENRRLIAARNIRLVVVGAGSSTILSNTLRKQNIGRENEIFFFFPRTK